MYEKEKVIRNNYFEELIKEVNKDYVKFDIQEDDDAYYMLKIPNSKNILKTAFNIQSNLARVWIHIHPDNDKGLFDFLDNNKEKIQFETGYRLKRLKKAYRICITKDIGDDLNFKDLINWHLQNAYEIEAFVNQITVWFNLIYK